MPTLYWHLNLFSHFKNGWTVCATFRLFPLHEWLVWHGTRYRPYMKAETVRLGPLDIQWFNRNTPWGP
jgi:hypothetical protein